ncbi:N-terminal acetyltransferase [Tulasnella sp. 424]|nr:N-terminal acetyltransferase [Tulasnella sp. 424]KAG8960092.1 N-terminal acetyltransferase [Tulasnella sp. 425]
MVVIKPTPSFYSDDQLSAYLSLLKLSSIKSQPSLANLNSIVRADLMTIPWENTQMHYEAAGHMDVAPEAIYKRAVVDRAGGSYCFGRHTLMLGMLLAMGYRAYGCTGRINRAPEVTDVQFQTRSHLVLLVQIPSSHLTPSETGDETYVVDLGFGLGIVRPMLLRDKEEMPGLFPPERHRLAKTYHPESSLDTTDPSTEPFTGEWRLEANTTQTGQELPSGSWRTLFQFSLHQYHLEEFEWMSRMVQSNPKSFFWNNLAVVLYTPASGESTEGEMKMGVKVMMGPKITYREEGKYEILKEMKNEADRISGLKEYFNIDYPLDAAINIQNKNAALGPHSRCTLE